MITLESPLSTITRHPYKDMIAVGGKNLMKIIEIKENNEFKHIRSLKVAKTSSKVGTTDLQWNPKFGIFSKINKRKCFSINNFTKL